MSNNELDYKLCIRSWLQFVIKRICARTHPVRSKSTHCDICISFRWTLLLSPLLTFHRRKTGFSNLWTWIMAFLYARFIWELAFHSLSIYFFSFPCSVWRLRSLGYTVPGKHKPPPPVCETFSQTLFEIHLQARRSLLLFNHALWKRRVRWREKCGSDVTSEWKPRE